MIMVNYTDLWLVYTQVVSQLKGAKLELTELKAHSLLLGACTSIPLLRSDFEVFVVDIKDLKHKLNYSSRYSVLSPPYELCGSLKGKLFHAIKGNTKLKQKVTYLTSRLERIVLSEKIIEENLSRVEESTTKFTYKFSVGFERCQDKDGKSAPKFIPNSNYYQGEKTIKFIKIHYSSNPKSSFNPKREVRKETPKPREEDFVCVFCGRAVLVTWMSFTSIVRELRRGALIL
jgi:hypothetical protein